MLTLLVLTVLPTGVPADENAAEIGRRLEDYATVRLTADLADLSANQKKMLVLFIEASEIMDGLFWEQAYGDRRELLAGLDSDPRSLAEINYGPWDRLNGDKPFLPGVGEKPAGACYYPKDMTKEEFEQADLADKKSLYTYVRRDDQGKLFVVPFHQAHAAQVERAAQLLEQAAPLAEDEGFASYLKLRAKALRSDDYQASDMAWMDMKNNHLELVIGPIETYEDQLFGYKTAYESYVLIKDLGWSKRLAHYAQFLPELQRGLPVPDKYKQETPGTDSDLNAYEVIYYAGHCNAGSKTIAINLPNDEEVQLQKGSRRLQLKNAMRAKFDRILVPIAGVLIAEDQRQHITFNAFFANTMFHEVAHGLGVKSTLDGQSTVRKAMKEHASALEEGKADILGLYMVTRLHEQGELEEGELMDYYTTFLAGIFRSVRFGASSAHGKANMIRFNFFKERGAFSRDPESGRYRVNLDKMREAMNALSEEILTIQGDGDYQRATALIKEMGVVPPQLQADLDRLHTAGIPVDVVFEQGVKVLGL